MRYDRSTFVSRLQNWVLGNVIGHSVVLFCLRMIMSFILRVTDEEKRNDAACRG